MDAPATGVQPIEPAKAHTTLLRLVLAPWIIHFKSQGYMKDRTMEALDEKCKAILGYTTKKADVRQAIGSDPRVWNELVQLFQAAIPSLESRSFAEDAASPDHEKSSSSTLIAANYQTLLKDLERLNDLVSIARNALCSGEDTQNLAAQCVFDKEVFKIITMSIKVTARGYDGDTGSVEEQRWQTVVNAYKKLLITCLQFLNNLVAQNERRKLMLWSDLFENPADGIFTQYPDEVINDPDFWPQIDGLANRGMLLANKNPHMEAPRPPLTPYFLYLNEAQKQIKHESPNLTDKEVAEECANRWTSLKEDEKMVWHKTRISSTDRNQKTTGNRLGFQLFASLLYPCDYIPIHLNKADKKLLKVWYELRRDLIQKWRLEMTAYALGADKQSSDEEHNAKRDALLGAAFEKIKSALEDMKTEGYEGPTTTAEIRVTIEESQIDKALRNWPDLKQYSSISILDSVSGPLMPTAQDYKVSVTADEAQKRLEDAKRLFLERLEPESPPRAVPPQHEAVQPQSDPTILSPASPVEEPHELDEEEYDEESEGEEEEEEEEEVEDSDDGYGNLGEDGRGLLTDVPLILGPQEIEVLPMIIMSGVVPPPTNSIPGYGSSPEETASIINMHTVRCHLLLAEDNGRNLLRELLIFVAAWDLREDELYFKFMAKIMEAVLNNGLMSVAYRAFRESKDIISPAQAVILKLVTSIFRSRQSNKNPPAVIPPHLHNFDDHIPPQYPYRVDVQVVSFFFKEFREAIMPHTCTLIYIQGQIRIGRAPPDEFPLNLWDMERMYEGVYQYLEFFAILTEHDAWKDMMTDWELTYELLELLAELEFAIPKGALLKPGMVNQRVSQAPGGLMYPDPRSTVTLDDGNSPAPVSQYTPTQPPVAVERPYDVTASDLEVPQVQDQYSEDNATYADEQQEEPSDFEWRNLKKLAVLVLSSLIWKNRKVQDQVRKHNGIPTILSCCNYDEHNPYIREHAIMCLRFLMEGNANNQDVIRELQKRQNVPPEVLDQHGYETFLDSKGQIGLRRKEILRAGLKQFQPPGFPATFPEWVKWGAAREGDGAVGVAEAGAVGESMMDGNW